VAQLRFGVEYLRSRPGAWHHRSGRGRPSLWASSRLFAYHRATCSAAQTHRNPSSRRVEEVGHSCRTRHSETWASPRPVDARPGGSWLDGIGISVPQRNPQRVSRRWTGSRRSPRELLDAAEATMPPSFFWGRRRAVLSLLRQRGETRHGEEQRPERPRFIPSSCQSVPY